MRRKHRNDYNHGKHGCIGGNPRSGKRRGNFRGGRAPAKVNVMRTIAEEYREWAELTQPADAGEVQRREVRRAFYSGVMAALSACRRVAEPDVSEEAGAAHLESWWREAGEFLKNVGRGGR